ncbi:MAG: hypothetical protein IJT65_05845 [Eubacterium sp.]|nr:hypothetical protein [Eubacterium sp.]
MNKNMENNDYNIEYISHFVEKQTGFYRVHVKINVNDEEEEIHFFIENEELK